MDFSLVFFFGSDSIFLVVMIVFLVIRISG